MNELAAFGVGVIVGGGIGRPGHGRPALLVEQSYRQR